MNYSLIKNKFSLIILSFLMVIVYACDKDENQSLISYKDGTDSHKHGEDCMNCHKSGGSGPGIFTVAGSIFNDDLITPYPNATVKIHIGQEGGGTSTKEIEVDARGNFFTTEPVDFSNSALTSVWSINGKEYQMESSISDGRCNKCHGISTEKIWIK